MSQLEFISADAGSVHGLALIQLSGEVWITFHRPWWDLTSWFWWWLSPGKKQWVQIRRNGKSKVRVRVWRAAKKHVRVGESL